MNENTGHQSTKSPNAVRGYIMSSIIENHCVHGDSGGSEGFSGGPVISLYPPQTLLGIALGGRGLPKAWPSDDFIIQASSFCRETPRLKILPAARVFILYVNIFKHTILALFCKTNMNLGRKGVKRPATDEEYDVETDGYEVLY